MTTKTTEQIARSVGTPKNEDRCTIVFQGYYLQWGSQDQDYTRWAYDRLVPEGGPIPAQFTLRVNPGRRTKLEIPGVEPGQSELVLGHKLAQLVTENDLIKQQQDKNKILVWNGDKLLGTIRPDRLMFGEFPGGLEVESTNATALLYVTAYPV